MIRRFFRDHPQAWWGLFLPLYLALFFILEHFITDNYWATETWIDAQIPFLPGFIFFYVSWAPMLVAIGLYLMLRDAEGFRRFIWMLLFCFVTASIFCVLVPNGQNLRPAVASTDLSTWLVNYTYRIDTNTNVFPSVHVLGVMAALAALWRTPGLRHTAWRVGGTVLSVMIIASTLFVKQHAFIDVIAGIVWGLLGVFVVYGIIGRRRDRAKKGCRV